MRTRETFLETFAKYLKSCNGKCGLSQLKFSYYGLLLFLPIILWLMRPEEICTVIHAINMCMFPFYITQWNQCYFQLSYIFKKPKCSPFFTRKHIQLVFSKNSSSIIRDYLVILILFLIFILELIGLKKKKNFEPLESDVLMQQLNYLKMPRENAILQFAKEVKGCFEIF